MNYAFTPQSEPQKHRVFISFHHQDEAYRDEFNRLYGHQFIGTDVKLGDIPVESSAEYIKRLIQEDHIHNSSVVIAMYGAETHKRKHVDWEISATLSEKVGGCKGLAVLILPDFPARPYDALGRWDQSQLYPFLHPRTAANLESGYADLYFWPGMYPNLVLVEPRDLIKKAVAKRETHGHLIENSHEQYSRNL